MAASLEFDQGHESCIRVRSIPVGVSEILLFVTDNSSLRADSFANEVEVVFAHVVAERQENQCADGLGDEGIAEDFVFVVEEVCDEFIGKRQLVAPVNTNAVRAPDGR